LRHAIDQLDPVDRELLIVLALVIEPIARSGWIELAGRHGIRASAARAFDGKTFAPHCERLVAADLVVSDTRHPSTIHYGLRGDVAMAVLERAHDEHELGGVVAARLVNRRTWRTPAESMIDLRLAVVLGDSKLAHDAFGAMYRGEEIGLDIVAALGVDPKPAWVQLLPHAYLRNHYLGTIVGLQSLTLGRLSEHVIDHVLADDNRDLRLEVARVLTLRGESTRAQAIEGLPKWGAEGIALLGEFWAGDFTAAHATGQRTLAAMKARKRPLLPDVEGVCHLFATIVAAVADPSCTVHLAAQLDAAREAKRVDPTPFEILANVHDVLVGGAGRVAASCTLADRSGGWLVALVHALHDLWLRPKRGGYQGGKDSAEVDAIAREVARHWGARAITQGYPNVAREFEAIVAAYDGASTAGRLAGAFHRRSPWEAALASLEVLSMPSPAQDAPADLPRRELIWEIDVHPQRVSLSARIRTGTRAKKGQSVALSRLTEGGHDDLLTDADRRVLAGIPAGDHFRLGGGGNSLPHRALLGMVGHPRIVGPDGLPIAVERGQPKVHTRTGPGGTKIELVPAALRDDAIAVQRPSPARVIIYERTAQLDRLADVLTRIGTLEIPDQGKDRLVRALTRLSATAGVAIEGDVEIGAAVVIADSSPLLQLGWTGKILSVRAAVAPLGPRGPHVRPGAGARELIADVTGEGLQRCTRDLAGERARIDAVLDACPTLVGFADGDLHWSIPDLPDALATILELDALGDTVTLAWQHGQKLDVPQAVDLQHLQLRVGVAKNWLELDVALAVDEHAVLQYRELLRGREGSRFVALSRGRFLVLSDRLRRHLDQLATLGSADGNGVRVAVALLPAVEELAADLEGASFDAATLSRIAKLREIATLVPRLPPGLQATLREYQREGFTWMARLAEAGLGACLADDMGLGKTVQALALLIRRAKLGPQLVVCPTSVVINWLTEAKRFAPSLRVTVLNTADDRAAALTALGPRDVLVCSYALLGTEIESLAALELATAVFDEAHALKNPRTQRATASRRIVADFRLALTGTPLENHLGELWSLFATIVPGLLGTQSEYETRFAGPIAGGNRERATQLRTILRPFMLRRLKASVLDELPPRTEITLKIAPYPEQRAFYEAVRRRAVEHMATLDPKKKRLGVLAEITKLRQAAIDPRVLGSSLEDGAVAPKGAKLDVLFERLAELRAEGHRALVFTQFLGSLAAVRERLLVEGIEFHELDGSTPAAVRARRIDAFQAGEGDVFLLSLRAGGVGVNLTGADYVFHLDPWWNPAVEDQATDRAHRIGQARPVTVYRLVTEGTIEEKILALHDSKRQLADDLLAGLERSDALDFDQLLTLLQQ